MQIFWGGVLPALMLVAAAPADGPTRAAQCAISAYVTDRDPNGLNVRDAPSAQARVVRTVSNAGSGVAVITGHNGGWFRVSNIDDAESDAHLFDGDGWVHGSLLGLDVANADPRLYASSNPRSRVLARLRADETRVTLTGCAGTWAQVRAEGRTGWLSPGGQCSNPLTTCA